MASNKIQKNLKLSTLDKRYIWHPFTQMKDWLLSDPTVIVSGRGSYLKDSNGKQYLDANSSIWTNLHGHNHPHLNRAIIQQLNRISHSSALGLANKPASLLAQKMIELTPQGLTKIFYSDDGSTAMEAALKIAFQFWQNAPRSTFRASRRTFLALEKAYHGDTVGAMSLGGSGVFHDPYRSLMFKTTKVMAPYCYRCPFNRAKPERADARSYRKCNWECISLVEKNLENSSRSTLHAPRFSAAVIEPLIQGAAGMIAHPKGYLKKFQTLCRQKEVLLIADEVMTGFGRTGTMFACEQEKISPDLLCVAKGFSGGYLPLAATLVTQKIYNAFLGDYSERKTFFHGHSYTANQLGCSAALANLEIFNKEKTISKIQLRGAELEVMLKSFWHIPWIGDIRRVGLLAGIELVQDWKNRTPFPWQQRVGARVCEEAKRHGVLTRPIGDVLVIMPPYCITSTQLGKICDVLQKSIRKVCDK